MTAISALRGLLKVSIRRFRFRCLSCKLAADGTANLVLKFTPPQRHEPETADTDAPPAAEELAE